ncbi:MAG: transposase [Aestuariivita sp.]|nr:transposase [Aestuariivita sp.]MCY4201242.1 transposase [Aestuariivita sp.]
MIVATTPATCCSIITTVASTPSLPRRQPPIASIKSSPYGPSSTKHRHQLCACYAPLNVPNGCWSPTLLDRKTYPAKALGNRYHQRWSIEELYKQIKPTLTIENFHATSRRGGQQEIYAGLTLVALARILSNQCEDYVNGPVNGPVGPTPNTAYRQTLSRH